MSSLAAQSLLDEITDSINEHADSLTYTELFGVLKMIQIQVEGDFKEGCTAEQLN